MSANPSSHVLDTQMPTYDVALTEHLAVDADPSNVFRAARDLDFLTVRTPLLATAFFVRGLPARLTGKASLELPHLRLFADPSSAGLPGWLVLGQVPDREIAFGAVGKFWQPDIECRTATPDPGSRTKMLRYWWLIRPFVGHIMRATLRTIAADAA